VAEIKRGSVARNTKLAGLAGGMAGRAALGFGKRMTGKPKDEVTAELTDKAARQIGIPAKLAIPLRVIASTIAIACQLYAHIPTKSLTTEMIPGFTA
jgi:hypothetical protein